MVLVSKKYGKPTFCVDYRTLNQKMKAERWPLQDIIHSWIPEGYTDTIYLGSIKWVLESPLPIGLEVKYYVSLQIRNLLDLQYSIWPDERAIHVLTNDLLNITLLKVCFSLSWWYGGIIKEPGREFFHLGEGFTNICEHKLKQKPRK